MTNKWFYGALLTVTAIFIGVLAAPVPAFLPDDKDCTHGTVSWIGEVGEKANLYTYLDGQNTCYMIIGELHGKTVSISCVRGR